MDKVNIRNYIEAWLENNAGRANSMSMHIQKITDENLELCIDGKVLQIGIPQNFYTSFSSDGIIRNTNCAFVAKSDESNSIELMTALNEKFDRLGSRGFYSFSSVLDSILDAFEKHKSSTEGDAGASKIDDEVLQEVLRRPVELIDLEISLAFAAADGYRDVFQPFPPFLLGKSELPQCSDVVNNSQIANPNGNPNKIANPKANSNKSITKHNANLTSIIRSFPLVSEMRLSANEDELKEKLAKSWLCTPAGKSAQKLGDDHFGKEVSQLPYNVLRFILSTNRPSLVFLSDDDDKILKLDNSHSKIYQFAVVQDSHEREVEHNVSCTFGFHGSNTENWYSILRNGLRCLSNTALMSSGTVMGEGIYLTSEFAYSARFATPGWHWKKSSGEKALEERLRKNGSAGRMALEDGMYKDGLHVVSICEAPSSLIKPAILWKDTFIVPKEHESNLAVKYLLVFTTDDKIPEVNIVDGHILSYGDHTVNLSDHYERIRRKYIAATATTV